MARRVKRVSSPLSDRMKQERIEEFGHHCRERGVPLTTQRRGALWAVLGLECRPTADQVHGSPAVRESRISRATVYRTLEGLVRLGIVTKACHTVGVGRV